MKNDNFVEGMKKIFFSGSNKNKSIWYGYVYFIMIIIIPIKQKSIPAKIFTVIFSFNINTEDIVIVKKLNVITTG